MSPADILAAARRNIVGPYLPAKAEWLEGWCGPGDLYGDPVAILAVSMGKVWYHWPGMWSKPPNLCLLEDMRLDPHRPEVRDHLVRLGCPEWARDVPAGVWAWGSGVEVRDVLEPSNHPGRHGYRYGREYLIEVGDDLYVSRHNYRKGWRLGLPVHARPFGVRDLAEGPETGDEGRACADLAALNAGCILRVEGGWLVPLPGGGVGYFKEPSP